MNVCILKGNLTRDPESKFLPSGDAVCDIGVAVSEVWYDKKDQKQERTSFFDCTAFGKSAESIGTFFKKGKPILIEGKLVQDMWEDKESGQKRSKIKIKIERWEFCGGDKADVPAEKKEGATEKKAPFVDDTDIPY